MDATENRISHYFIQQILSCRAENWKLKRRLEMKRYEYMTVDLSAEPSFNVSCGVFEREWTDDVPLSFRMGKKDNDREINEWYNEVKLGRQIRS